MKTYNINNQKTKVLDYSDIDYILNKIDLKGKILFYLIYSGIQINEIREIKLSNIDLNNKIILLANRNIDIANSIIKDFIDYMHFLINEYSNDCYLFQSKNNDSAVSSRSLNRLLKIKNLDFNLSDIRHTALIHMLEIGYNHYQVANIANIHYSNIKRYNKIVEERTKAINIIEFRRLPTPQFP